MTKFDKLYLYYIYTAFYHCFNIKHAFFAITTTEIVKFSSKYDKLIWNFYLTGINYISIDQTVMSFTCYRIDNPPNLALIELNSLAIWRCHWRCRSCLPFLITQCYSIYCWSSYCKCVCVCVLARCLIFKFISSYIIYFILWILWIWIVSCFAQVFGFWPLWIILLF